MQAIEPVQFNVEGSGLDPTDYQERFTHPTSNWEETHDYILHQSLEKCFNEISHKTLMDDFREHMNEKTEAIDGYIPGLSDQFVGGYYPGPRAGIAVYHMPDVIAVPNPAIKGVFYLISNNKDKLRDIRGRVLEDLQRTPETFGALGVDDITIHSEQDFTIHSLENTESVKSIETGEMDDFEETIYKQLNPISEAFVNNVKVSFEYPQEPEYDLVFSLGPGHTITIEVEDHSGTDSEPNQSDLIDDPAAESEYINASQAFSVCKGVSSDLLGQFKPKAELTNVNILEEDQASDSVLTYIREEMVPDAINLRPTPSIS